MGERLTVSDIHPCLCYADARAAIEFLCRAFGFETRLVVDGPDGSVMHSELELGSGVVMVSSPKPERGWAAPAPGVPRSQGLSVFVPDPDAHHARAVREGAVVVTPLRDEEYGARGYTVRDPEGHEWYFGNYRPGSWWSK